MHEPGAENQAVSRARDLFRQALDMQMSGQLEDAERLYSESIRLHPTAEAHTFLGWTYSFQGNLDNAINECKKAIAVDPSFGNPYNDIGAYLIDQGREQEAIPWLFKAMTASRYDCPFYPHVNLARIYENWGLWPKALLHFQEAARLKPDYTVALQGLDRMRAKLN